jgi:ubiquinone/menaquinone biosynthesis C-methylase UbiE
MTVRRLAEMAELGTVRGVDYSKASVAAARRTNKAGIESGRVEIQSASVSQLPFPDESFDLVTAVETHYYWPDFVADLREIWRVLKPGGTLLIVAEVHAGQWTGALNRLVMKPLGGTVLSPDQHRESFVAAGYSDVEVFLEDAKGWICVRGAKPR